MEEHVVEGVTYEIVDVVDAGYARLANADEENAADVEYLELDMEVVEAVSDAASYFSNAEESQEEGQHVQHVVKSSTSSKGPQIIQVNGNQCFTIKEERMVNGDEDRGRKRQSSETSVNDGVYADRDSDEVRVREASAKSECDSLDLFFQSMAQTVLHLPPQVQAKIKMDICKVITMAEIKYCSAGDKRKSQ